MDEVDLIAQFRSVRALSERLVEPLDAEDCVIQSMPDVSPPKWHLAHTTWFFETFVLEPFAAGWRAVDPSYRVLFNSYYEAVGDKHPRPRRGLLSRPRLAEVMTYRRQVGEAVAALLSTTAHPEADEIARRVTVGLHHEQQHQELLLMDVLHNFWCNPLRPAYAPPVEPPAEAPRPVGWREVPPGIHEIGHAGPGFCFDNELPRHRVLLPGCTIADRLVTCEEYLAFMGDGGYRRPELWLSDGWALVQTESLSAPLYWRELDGQWHVHTLRGERPVAPAEPVVHVSYYEADAFARWAGARLPGEAECEVAAAPVPVAGNFLDSGALHPRPAGDGPQVHGDVWAWTHSDYAPYPGFRPLPGALGEYNGKFMCNQRVLRGGACITPRSHARVTYRNFYYPHQRWPFTGIRLARDLA